MLQFLRYRFVLVWLAGTLPLGAVEVANEEPVRLPPVRVVPLFPGYGLSFTYTKRKDAPPPTWPIREVRFHVERAGDAYRAGLRSGDRLIAINGTPVVGKTWPEFNSLVDAINRERKAGEPRRYRYTLLRGSEKKEIEVTLSNGDGA